MKKYFVLAVILLYSNFLTAQDPSLDTEGDFVEGYSIIEMYLLDVESAYDLIPYTKEFRERLYVMVVQLKGREEMIYSVAYHQSKDVFALASVIESDCNIYILEELDLSDVTCYTGDVGVVVLEGQDGSFFITEKLVPPSEQDENEYARFTFQMESGSFLQVVGRKFFSSED